ncbi:MAG: preprotein translocase subunit SecA [Chthoniobacteraceae bacterium]
MIGWLIKKVIGSKNVRMLKGFRPTVEHINTLEIEYQKLSDDELRAKTFQWKEDLAKLDPVEHQDYLNGILPEAFALVKNAARRLCNQTFNVCDQPYTWIMVHFDVQLLGGICLHRGMIAEMATGEGKTLVATLPLYLNALTGRGAHLVTTNDYLARRDAETMGQLYGFLGLTTGVIQHDQSPTERRSMYGCDITYGMNSEFGFDYLRDNGMATTKEQQVQRPHYFAIVDEVDSILIDEARTPLIISGPATVSTHQFDRFRPLVDQIVKKQTMLVNRLASEAEATWSTGDTDLYGQTMVKVKWGSPRNKGLLRAMEEPEKRKVIEKRELSYFAEHMKEEKFKLQDELFFTIDERQHEADLTELGRNFMNPEDPDAFVLPDLISQFAEIDTNPDLDDAGKVAAKDEAQALMDKRGEAIHNISQLLRAYCLYEKDVHYVVEEGKVVIVDEFTGRKMTGRRWSDGLHGAVEAKEGVTIDRETQTLATITIQNYFRLYEKLSGMTGTAETEANEFHDVYKLDVAVVPTNQPNIRNDENDFIYKTRREKFIAVVQEIATAHARQQPVLVGTVSVEASEVLSRMLKREKIPHAVLNAKYHMQEAEIIARAGQPGTVTISTNMAGRGTDIKLGLGVIEVGGLYVLGTERHEARRIDRQLRGRCARQGDPGLTRFYVSFEDDLMRNFAAADRLTKMMERFGLKEGESLEHPWLNKSVETAQKRVEQRNYLIRKRSLEFDDVMNKQREVIYGWRNEAINTNNPREMIYEVVDEAIPEKVISFLPPDDERNPQALLNWCNSTFPLGLTMEAGGFEKKDADEASNLVIEKVKHTYELKCSHEEAEALRYIERTIMLNAIDRLWQEHLYAMDSLREAVYLRAYGQKDPLVEYKNEAYEMFTELMENIKGEILHNMFRSTSNLLAFEQFLAQLPMHLLAPQLDGDQSANRSAAPLESSISTADGEQPSIQLSPQRREIPKVGRNDPCPCGSGKKFKNCCGKGVV